MLDIGWTELLVIGVVALIVVGPKDLPGMFRALGQFTGKMRMMARDFQRAMNDAADDTGLKETASGLKSMTSAKSLGLDAIKSAASNFDNWDADQPEIKPKSTKPNAQTSSEVKTEDTGNVMHRADPGQNAREMRDAVAQATQAATQETPAQSAAKPRPGTPTARAARPKNMPKKKTRGR